VGSIVLDASAVIALLDGADAHHGRATTDFGQAVERGDALVIPASAYAEAMVHPLRKKRGEVVDGFLDRLGVEVVDLDRAIAREAAALRARHRSLPLPDALVIATARRHGAGLLTYDDRMRGL
jgi:predicted nucleic acid-binding protein